MSGPRAQQPQVGVSYRGRVVDIGELDHGTGITVQLDAGRQLTITGMTRDEVRSLREAFAEPVTLTIEARR